MQAGRGGACASLVVPLPLPLPLALPVSRSCHSTLMRYPHDPLLPLPPPRPSPGHSYLAYGPLLNHATQVVFEGVPTYPDAGRCWEVIDK